MTISHLNDSKNDTLIIFADDSKKILGKLSDASLLEALKPALAMDFKGRLKENLLLYPTTSKVKRLLIIGTGPEAKLSGYSLRSLASHAISSVRNLGVTKNIGILLPTLKKLDIAETAQALAEGQEISQLNFFEFKTDRKPDEKHRYEKISLDLLLSDKKDLKAATAGFQKGLIIGQGVNFGRDLIMTPGSHLNPAELAKAAMKMVQGSPSKSKIKAQVWTEKELAKNGYGGILGVGQGSTNPPRFIILEYSNAKKSEAPIILVGKGITFDSGGLSLKPPAGMETMKYDMAGSASVLSAFKITADLGLKVNLVCLVPSAENMPSGTAIRPGDVLHMASGKTVEVLNTDAEGRLVLADALHYATTHYKPRCVIDVATLTGACAMAVGEAAFGVFSNSKKLMNAIEKTSQSSQENAFPLPNYPEVYGPMVRSDIADIKNTGGKNAGASTASMFLNYFVSNNAPWAHFDIAGCGWYDAPRDYITTRGSSGVPIRFLADFIENNASAKFN